MDVATTRFGRIAVDESDLLAFPQGLIGLRDCRRWCLLADVRNPALGWLQCADAPDVALGIVSPRRFVPEYQLRTNWRDLAELRLESLRDAQVAVVVNRLPEGLAANLRAPIVINLANRRGCQLIASDPLPTRHLLVPAGGPLRRTA
jgi:flagellar assembly factor FliW